MEGEESTNIYVYIHIYEAYYGKNMFVNVGMTSLAQNLCLEFFHILQLHLGIPISETRTHSTEKCKRVMKGVPY